MSDQPAKPTASPPWSRTTRLIVGLSALALVVFLMWRFQALVGQIIVAAMLAYILEPLIGFLSRRLRFSRALAAIVVYLLLTLVVMSLVGLIGVAVANQVTSLWARIPEFIDSAAAFYSQVTSSRIDVGQLHLALDSLDWKTIQSRLLEMGTPALGQSSQVAVQGAFGAVDFLGWLAVTFIISIYIAIDLPRLGDQIGGVAQQSGYRDDYNRLIRQTNRIWSRYLRGQIILGIISALITFITLLILGVDGSLALGVISGVLQLVPYVGPTLSAVIIVLVALFQPANYIGLAPLQYALLVGVVILVVQQVSGNVLLPTVVGGALNMSPLTVLISLIAGAAVAGLLGVILAAPVVATLRVVVGYVWRKLLGEPPFPEAEPPPTQVSMVIRRTAALAAQIQKTGLGFKPVNKIAPENAKSTEKKS